MNSLLETGISQESIDFLLKLYNEDVKKEIINNEENIKDNVLYLKSIDINNVEDLMEENITIFFQQVEKTKEMVNRIGLEKVRNDLESDPYNISILIFRKLD